MSMRTKPHELRGEILFKNDILLNYLDRQFERGGGGNYDGIVILLLPFFLSLSLCLLNNK